MSAAGLPRWVWDLVIDLERQEDEHPKLFVDTSAGFVRSEWCPGKALEHVPDEVRYAAKVIAAERAGAK